MERDLRDSEIINCTNLSIKLLLQHPGKRLATAPEGKRFGQVVDGLFSRVFLILLLTIFSIPACTGGAKSVHTGLYENMVDKENSEFLRPVDLTDLDKGYQYFKNKQYQKACPFFYRFISENNRDAQNYEWAEFFLGVSLKKCGFSHASVDILSYLVTRKPNTKIVTYTLELFEEITRTIPFDREKVLLKSVSDHDYGFVNSALTDFIHYHQGLFDWKNGFNEWGDNHFKMISKGSYYYYRYLYQAAIYDIFNDDIDSAIEVLSEINEASFDGEELRNSVRKTLARLLYEKKEYEKADLLYESISSNIVYQAQNLLERAWAHYRMGNQEKAMGLLYAFKAPAYRDYFTPEYFLLKSFLYKDVCHYEHALSVIDDFNEYYRESIHNIYDRKGAAETVALLPVILGKESVRRQWEFLTLLENEKKQIGEFEDLALKEYLERIYTLQIMESSGELKHAINENFEEIADDLLEYEEKAGLTAYEIGLDMYQRIYRNHYSEERKKEAAGDSYAKHYYAIFPFQGEFWNDEIDNYKVTLQDKCSCMEELDIFFK